MALATLIQPQADASPSTRFPQPPSATPDDGLPVVLALDLGQRTGWALRGRDGAVLSGMHEFRPGRFEGGGAPLLRFKHWLTELKATAGGLDAVFFEEVRGHKGTLAAQVYGAFLGQLGAWCEHHGIAYEGVPVGTIKRHVAGKGNANKDAVISAVRALGFDPNDDNEADALALLHWALANRMAGSGATVAPVAPGKRGGPR